MTTHEVVLPMFSPMMQKPAKRYRTLVADPPWHYEARAKDPTHQARNPFGTMRQHELLNMPVGLWADDNAHLYLWTTNAFMAEAHQIVKSWGFSYKTMLTWVKRSDFQDRWIGMGDYYRGVTEHVLFATKGHLPVLRHDQSTLFYGARGAHSEKPAGFYDMVETMSVGPYLDVFARKQRFNWDTFGNEAFNFGTDKPAESFLLAADATPHRAAGATQGWTAPDAGGVGAPS